MKKIFNKKFLDHNISSDFEGGYRLKAFSDLPDTFCEGEKYLDLVHTPEYIQSIKESCAANDSIAEIRLTPTSYEAACLAVGLTIKASEDCDFAVVRPPGHHAAKDRASGFCLFNNIAIAAQKLANEGKKVFILDIDGHHGDGTQRIFYESKQVFYCSIHQQNMFPYTGTLLEFGKGQGIGYTLNIPVAENCGEKGFLNAIQKSIDTARKFEPNVIGISTNFDNYQKNKLLGLNLPLHAFYECGFQLSKSFKNIFAVLEGGYHDDLRECVDNFVEGVNKGALPTKIKWNPELSIG